MATVGNFGKLGDKPTHPELLDWLAVELRRGRLDAQANASHDDDLGGSSASRPERRRKSMEADPGNSLVSRVAAFRRMDADQLYDSMLLVTGQLDPERFGPPAETR